ncbi:conjugal transfer protein TraI, partial [Leptospira interrogans serovar Pomona]|nr:conjugal transfer protein TraI [Leptospira interrogans serovar Pomona]
MADWTRTWSEFEFFFKAKIHSADRRAEIQAAQPVPSQEQPDIQQAVTQAIAGLSERKVQFTYTDVLARTGGMLPPEDGGIEKARAGIEEAISREELI